MAQGNRQNSLFAAEDFTVLYDSFANSNFKAYDFDTIRAAMVNYIQNTYPEEFNDWIQSSEFVALLDVVAYFGHSLAFRLDYATRENFFGTAQRRESLIRLANLVNYKVRRNIPAFGLVKIVDIRTNEIVYDTSGNNLQNKKVVFETSTDYENFITVINAVLQQGNQFGTPSNTETNNSGQKYDFYRMNTNRGQVVFQFNSIANGVTSPYELVGLTFDSITSNLVENTPSPEPGFDIIYQNNNTGIGGNDTGFFMGLKQGNLVHKDFTLSTPRINQILDINTANVNNTDVWVQNINTDGTPTANWKSLGSLTGSNVIYNSLTNTDRNIYSVESRVDNKVSVKFSDGNFGNIPSGLIRTWYRTSKNESFTVRPVDIGKQTITVTYTGADGNLYTANIGVELRDNISTASSSESLSEIRLNAPQTYATQDRMVNAEDYTVYPYSVSSNIKKIKSINRTHSGHSRFVDTHDPTGNYQDVTHFGDDGILYRTGNLKTTSLNLPSTLSNTGVIERYLEPYLIDSEIVNFYYTQFTPSTFNYTKATTSNGTNAYKWQKQSGATGYLTTGSSNIVQRVGKSSSGNLRYIKPGSLCEFVVDTSTTANFVEGEIASISVVNQGSGYSSPTVSIIGAGTGATATAIVTSGNITGITITAGGSGYDEFTVVQVTDSSGVGFSGTVNVGSLTTIWSRVTNISGEGLGVNDSAGNSTGVTESGLGSIVLSKEVPSNARLKKVWPAWNTRFTDTEKADISNALTLNQNFGLRYDTLNSKWMVINSNNIPSNTSVNNAVSAWSLANAGSTANNNADQSWIIRVNYATDRRTFISRTNRYIFETHGSTKFFNNNSLAKIDPTTSKPRRDKIELLANNNRSGTTVARLGTAYSWNLYGNFIEKDGHTDSKKVILTLGDPDNANLPDNPDAFANVIGTDTIKIGTVTENGFDYTRHTTSGTTSVSGRTNLYFRYDHVAETDKRIDPASINIVDMFVLTNTYHTNFSNWLQLDGRSSTKPLQPSIEDLSRQFGSLDSKKSASDTIVYRPVKYKVLFGDLADSSLRATFRIVKVPGTSFTDTEIKSKVINAVNTYFDPAGWDFGETFYFTELSAYIHQQLAGVVASFVIVPQDSTGVFGSLFQITPNSDELFINGATVDNIDIVSNLSRSNLQSNASGQFVNTSTGLSANTGVYTTTSGGTGLSGSGGGGSSSGGGGSGGGGGGYGGY